MLTTHRSIALFCFTAVLAAQSPGPGLTWNGSSGASAGSFFPSCTDLPVPAMRGETITLRTWGDPNSLFAVFASATASSVPCVPIPGLGNGLMLGAPVITITIGTLTHVTPCLSCPPYYEDLVFMLPAALPPGAMASFQSAGYGANNPSFTVAITATVQ